VQAPTPPTDPTVTPARSRWRGQPGRLEVWYTTLTDPVTGTGVWIHHELVAPADGAAAHGHGWVAVFRPGSTPAIERFGPEPWAAPVDGFETTAAQHVGPHLVGAAGPISWDLTSVCDAPALHTFPRWAWHRELLPAAQIVPDPTAHFSGTLSLPDGDLVLVDAPGANARIYGHGNARSWGWLHADLGDGAVCEVVAAVSTRPGLRLLPPLAFVQLRLPGEPDSPRDPALAAFRTRTRLGADRWSVRGPLGGRRLEIDVRLPAEETVEVDYADPDGHALVCRNSERADAHVRLLGRSGRRWVTEREWRLDGPAHAEVGGRAAIPRGSTDAS
jgi:hypothetical protein